jgi:predicted short-subunit dehydrogenase-like oxidoreductase (DUF2520 family)
MRQVPASPPAPLGVVGDGRVARHFLHYFNLLALPVRTWSRRQPASGPVAAFAECDTVLVLIRDAAIVPFVDAWPELQEKRLVHFSGSLVTDKARAAHPLMAFTDTLYDLDTYRTVPFVLDSADPPFADLLPGLPNPTFVIPSTERPRYHALCVLASNGSTLLWQRLLNEFSARFGIPPSAVSPFLRQTTANLVADPAAALTGPLTRGDTATIQANLAALEGDPWRDVYAALVRAYELG